jgi:hypothetical protein
LFFFWRSFHSPSSGSATFAFRTFVSITSTRLVTAPFDAFFIRPWSGSATFAFRTFVLITSTRLVTAPFDTLFIRPWSGLATFAFRTFVSITSARLPRSPSSPLLSPLLSTLLFFALHRRKEQADKILPTHRHQAAGTKVLHLVHLGHALLFLLARLFLLHRPVTTILPHAMHASQYGQRREGRMSDVIYFINVFYYCVPRNFLCTAKIVHMAPSVFVHLGRTVLVAFSFLIHSHDGGRL